MSRLRWQSVLKMPAARHAAPNSERPSGPGRRSNWLIGLLVLVLLMVVAAMAIEKRVAPVLFAWAEAKAVNLATQAIHHAVDEAMAEISSLELAEILTDDQGRIQAIKYDTIRINQTSAAVVQKVMHALSDLDSETLAVPLGQFLGSKAMAAFGPKIPLRVIPAGAVTATPISSFVSAGINQTVHRLYLDIHVQMRVVVPLASTVLPVSTRVALIEDVIVGAVPSWYFASGGLVGGFNQQSTGLPESIEFNLNQ